MAYFVLNVGIIDIRMLSGNGGMQSKDLVSLEPGDSPRSGLETVQKNKWFCDIMFATKLFHSIRYCYRWLRCEKLFQVV